MRHFLTHYSIIFLLLLVFTLPANAAQSYSHLYISISDALMNTKQDKNDEATAALNQFAQDWAQIQTEQTEAKSQVDQILSKALQASSKEERSTALSELSRALRHLEKLENPVDIAAQRREFEQKFQPVISEFEQALATGNIDTIKQAYKKFNSNWKKSERPIREQSVAMYGQIETQMAFLRITLSSEQPEIQVLESQFSELKQTINDFIAGKETASLVEGDYSIATLIAYIDEANSFIDAGDYQAASDKLRDFIKVWPNVEQDISTRNGGLYTKIESEMPIIISQLLKSDTDVKSAQNKLSTLRTEIQLIQDQADYSIWDAALILLREGLEALLIILALISFLNKSKQQHMKKWIYVGAFAGIVLSAIAAIAMSTIFSSNTINTQRELMEGYIGLAAAIMMLGIGIWLHRKSNIASWNNYITKQLNNAISRGSILSMAAISFLSVFREGAETIVFYAGIAPKMPITHFILGIAVALAILAIVAIILFKASGKIPIHRFFAVATVLIYVLTFKIIGVSLHTLQLTNRIPTTIVEHLPVIPVIGFYPTLETILGQAILLLIIAATIYYKKRQR
ncbi:FTR1 family iron permease [Bacillus ndiopicus]|uniref:FTR1 family iron permease n=1 Tax=Bacillus ndiopicus TaxID=1347368 RepID=UPI0005A951CE|nr:FTR1 family protein [Bacillus ndiopicus]